MAKFVKKGALDRYPEVSGGQSDPNCTHVILTEKEYSKLLDKVSVAEQKARDAKYNAEREIGAAKQEARYAAQKAAQEARETVEAIEDDLAAERAESAHQRALNADLLRVAKERANADRGIRPKKQHTGYGVVVSGEKEHRYRDGNRSWRKVLLWETVIQSPYTIDLSEEVARKQIMDELLHQDAAGERLIYRLGLDAFYDGSYGAMMDDRRWCAEPAQYNIMLKPRFQANGRYGYWEVIFFHTKPLGVIPKELRLRQQ